MIQADLRKLGLKVDDPQSDAGLHIAQKQEDVLTSIFFGILKNLSLSVWNAVLPAPTTAGESASPAVQFWPRFPEADLEPVYRNTEPDVVLEFPRSVVFVEVKYLSDFGDRQLEREWSLGSHIADKRKADFHLLTVTRRAPDISDRARHELGPLYKEGKVHHIFWETIYEQLSALTEFADDTEKRFIHDLVYYLSEKGLTPVAICGGRTFLDYFPTDGREFLDALQKVKSFDEDDEDVSIFLDACSDGQLTALRSALDVLLNSKDVVAAPSNVLTGGLEFLQNYLLQYDSDKGTANPKAISDFLYGVLSTAYYSRTLCLRATRDFSVSARTKTSGTTVISFFTFYRTNRKLVFQLHR